MEYLEIMKNGIMEHLKRQEGPQEVLQWSWMWISVNLLLIFYLWMWECAMAWPVPHVCPSSVAGLHGISYLSPRCIRVEPATALTHHLQNCETKIQCKLVGMVGHWNILKWLNEAGSPVNSKCLNMSGWYLVLWQGWWPGVAAGWWEEDPGER